MIKTEKIKILMPILDAGSGHRKPAEAVKESLEKLYPGRFEIRISDIAREAGALRDDYLLKKSWDMALRFPLMAHSGYFCVQLPFSKIYLKAFFGDFVRKAITYIADFKPDIIFSTHFYGTSVSCIARKEKQIACKIISHVVDPHRLWAEKMADYIIIDPQIVNGNMAIIESIDKNKILFFRFPVSDKFLRKDGTALKQKLGIDNGLMTCLANIGGQGIGKTGLMIKTILKCNIPLNVIAVSGKNARLKDELDMLAKENGRIGKLVPFAYADNMDELMAASDFVIGKGGPSSTFEALSLKKPIVYTHWATFTEKPLVDFIISKGAGAFASNTKKMSSILSGLQDKAIYGKYLDNISSLSYRSGADEIAAFIAGNAP